MPVKFGSAIPLMLRLATKKSLGIGFIFLPCSQPIFLDKVMLCSPATHGWSYRVRQFFSHRTLYRRNKVSKNCSAHSLSFMTFHKGLNEGYL